MGLGANGHRSQDVRTPSVAPSPKPWNCHACIHSRIAYLNCSGNCSTTASATLSPPLRPRSLGGWPASRTVGAAIRESDRNKRIERRMALLQKLGASMRRSSPSQLTLSRSFAADAHGSAKVPMWNAPGSPSTWKEEHFVFVSLAGWGSLIYGGYKFFTSGPKKPSASGPAPCPEGMERVPVKKH